MRLQELEDLTVVILTYRRHNYLEEILGFWSDYPVNLVVVDGTENPFGGLLPNERCSYVHLPDSYHERLKKAVEMVETSFVIQACDDELYSPLALASAVRFLKGDSRYVSCLGEAVGFTIENGDLAWKPQYPALREGSAFEEDPSIRTIQHLGNYTYAAHFYSVNRTEVWRTVWRHVLLSEFPSLVRELQFEIGASFAGNVKIIPEVMWVRNQFEEKATGGVVGAPQVASVVKWWDSCDACERKKLLRNMGALLSLLAGERQGQVKHEVGLVTALAFESYTQTQRPKSSSESHTQTQRPKATSLIRRIGCSLIFRLRLLRNQTVSEEAPDSATSLSSLVGPGTIYDEPLLADIARRLMSAAAAS